MKITIEQADNGFIIFYPDYMEGADRKEIEVTKSYVVEEKGGEFAEQEAFVQLCLELIELLGVPDSKHNRRRVRIELTEENKEADQE
jgi:hypothetical protein